jgi:hypothetical protein
MRKLISTMLVLVLSQSDVAVSDVIKRPDRNEVEGPLDIKSVSHGHSGRRAVIHSVRMHDRWQNGDLRNDSSHISLLFDRRRNSVRDNRHLRIDYSKRRGLHARMTKMGVHGPGEFISRVAVWRPSRRSVRVRFRIRLLGRNVHRYEWRAITSYEDDADCSSSFDSADQGGCIDSAPGKRRKGIKHDLNR